MTVKWSGRSFGHISRYSAATPIAALTLNFLTTTSLDSRITFTRASSATRVNASGVVESVTANTPRFDYDPVTLAPRGLLVEEQRTNLVTYSEQFDNAAWTKSNATVSANATTSPDGTVDADKLVEDTANASHHVRTPYTATNATLTVSIYAKAAERSNLLIQLSNNATGAATCNFNLANGTAGTATNGGDFTGTTAAIQSVGNGWYRCSITTTKGSTNTVAWPYFFVMNSGSSTANYQGDGTSGIFLYGAQLEAGAFATSYIPTVASQVTRSADVATMTGTNFSSWFNASEGTFVTQSLLSRQAAIALTAVATVNDGTNSNTLHTFYRAAGTTGFQSTVAGVTTADMNMGPAITAGTVAKIAGAYQVNNFAASTNGGSPVTTASGTLPTVNRLQLGSGIGVALNGHIQSFAYYPTPLSNAQLQALTA